MSNEEREQQMMTVAEAYAAEIYKDEPDNFHTDEQLCETINDFCAGWREADQHPAWIPVEKVPFPPKKNKWDKISEEVLVYGILPSGRHDVLLGSYHYNINEWGVRGLMTKITHWMEIVPPQRKEE